MLQIIITYINQKYQLGYKKRNNKNIPGRRNEDGSSAQVLTPSPSPFVPRLGLRPSRSAGVRPFDKAIQASKERH